MPSTSDTTRRPWNLGRLIGPKPPFNPKHIWAIRTRLQHEGRTRDLALFNTAIDGKLRGCDLVRMRVADVHLGDGARLRTTIVQQKTGRPVLGEEVLDDGPGLGEHHGAVVDHDCSAERVRLSHCVRGIRRVAARSSRACRAGRVPRGARRSARSGSG